MPNSRSLEKPTEIAPATPLAEAPFDNIVTVVSVGEHQWAKVQFEKMTREGKEKREMWVNSRSFDVGGEDCCGKVRLPPLDDAASVGG